jgi:hypothetical protein
MNSPPWVASSPIGTVRSSGITCTSSCEIRPMRQCFLIDPVPSAWTVTSGRCP